MSNSFSGADVRVVKHVGACGSQAGIVIEDRLTADPGRRLRGQVAQPSIGHGMTGIGDLLPVVCVGNFQPRVTYRDVVV